MSEITGTKKNRGVLKVLIPLYILGSGIYTITLPCTILGLDEPVSLITIPFLLFPPLIFIFSIASWRWKKWGCFGIMAITLIGVIYAIISVVQLMILGGSADGIVFVEIVLAAGAAVQLGIMYALYKSKEQYFE